MNLNQVSVEIMAELCESAQISNCIEGRKLPIVEIDKKRL